MHDRGMGDQLQLRPPREDDLTIIEMLTQDPEKTGEFAWFGWRDPLRWRDGQWRDGVTYSLPRTDPAP